LFYSSASLTNRNGSSFVARIKEGNEGTMEILWSLKQGSTNTWGDFGIRLQYFRVFPLNQYRGESLHIKNQVNGKLNQAAYLPFNFRPKWFVQ
jgi:hypothetical protein